MKNERFVDFTFDPGRVDFCAGLVVAAHGCFHLSETGLSGQGQEENICGGKRSKKQLISFCWDKICIPVFDRLPLSMLL
jgi:hypothetical protein